MILRRLSTTSAPNSPVQRATDAPDEDAFWVMSSDLLHWLWSWQLQYGRLKESTFRDGQGSTPMEMRQAFSRTSLDEHLLAVVGGHVVKAMEQFGDELPANMLEREHLEALRLLRNLYEHWVEQRVVFQDPTKRKVRSAKEFVEGFPDGRPYSITYSSADWLLAGVVPLKKVTAAMQALASAIVELESSTRTRGNPAIGSAPRA